MGPIPLSFITIIIVSTIAQSVFLIFVLLYRDSQSYRHLFLGSLFFVLIWFQLEFLAIRETISIDVPWFYGTRFGSWLAVGPLILLYVKAHSPAFKFSLGNGLHFLPFFLAVVILPFFFAFQLPDDVVFYGMLTYLQFPREVLGGWYYFYMCVFILQFVHLLVYIIVSIRKISRHEAFLRTHHSEISRLTLKWLRRFLFLIGGIIAGVLAFLILSTTFKFYYRELDYLYIAPMMLFIYLVSFKVLMNPPSVPPKIQAKASSKKKYQKSGLNADQIERLSFQLTELMKKEQLHLKSDLTLKELASPLNIPPYQLSQFINQHKGQSFYEFVNSYRVEEVKQMLHEGKGEKMTLLAIAFAAGFNNKSSFINHFKKNTGMTPSGYLKKIKPSN